MPPLLPGFHAIRAQSRTPSARSGSLHCWRSSRGARDGHHGRIVSFRADHRKRVSGGAVGCEGARQRPVGPHRIHYPGNPGPDRQHRLLPHSGAAPECTCKGAQKAVDTALHSAGLGRVEFMLGDEHPPTLLEGNFLSPNRRWLDLRYLENWSLALDALIMGKTLSVIVKRSGAY